MNRFCIDFRRKNAATKFDPQPVAYSGDILAKLQKDQYFTKIDFGKGYSQIPVAEESKPITAFSMTDGCYQFCKMLSGLMSAVVLFNRTMRKLLADVKDEKAYVDDVIQHTVTWVPHIANLRVLFGKIREVGVTIHPSKCMIGFKRVDFLGHVVENGTITMETDKLEKIQDVEPPTTKKQVRAFIGLAGYYRKFTPNSAIPFIDLTKTANESYLGIRTAARIQCSTESAEQSPYTSPTGF